MTKKLFALVLLALGAQFAVSAIHTTYATNGGYTNCCPPRSTWRGRRWNNTCCPRVRRCRPKRECCPTRRVCRPRQKCCTSDGYGYRRRRSAIAPVVATPVEMTEEVAADVTQDVADVVAPE